MEIEELGIDSSKDQSRLPKVLPPDRNRFRVLTGSCGSAGQPRPRPGSRNYWPTLVTSGFHNRMLPGGGDMLAAGVSNGKERGEASS